MIEVKEIINGIPVSAIFSERAVREIFLPLLKHLTDLREKKGRRILVLLAAPPGSGKTTLLTFLQKLSENREGIIPLQGIGMDGFHRRQAYLESHYVMRDGKQLSMVQIKGAPVTFDLEKLSEKVKRVAEGQVCTWPVYDRMLHNPVEDAVRVDGEIILLEGNYLLLDEDGWRDMKNMADYTVSVRADAAMLRSRLIERRIKTGVEREKAVAFVDASDMPNVTLCLERSMKADLMLELDENGDYYIVE